MNFDTREEQLEQVFNEAKTGGRVKAVTIIRRSETGQSRGYGFVEFRDERDANEAVKRLDGRKIDGFRVIVDREFGRTKHSWYPKRLGGGKGDSRRDRSDEQILRMI